MCAIFFDGDTLLVDINVENRFTVNEDFSLLRIFQVGDFSGTQLGILIAPQGHSFNI